MDCMKGATSMEPSKLPENLDEEARQFVATLQQTGQLADVSDNEDVSKLPARITHVRYPSGLIRRIRFAGPGQSGESQ